MRYASEEYAAVRAAADLAGYTPAGFVATSSVSAARGVALPDTAPLRQALAELMAARTQVRGFGVNVNQAVAVLHASGEAPVWLEHAAEVTVAAVRRLDASAAGVADRIRCR